MAWILDSTIVLLVPALLLAMWAQYKVKSAYKKYAKVGVRSGLTGADVAGLILRDASITVTADAQSYPAGSACGLECIGGEMTDHYDPRTRTLRLSRDVYHGRTVAAIGIAAHEVGHALQHANAYAPLSLRNVVYPVCGLGSQLAFPLFFIGFFFRFGLLLQLGIILYTTAVFFTVLTLPVEFNASRRALRILKAGNYLDAGELTGARKVLSAAAMTYVAAAVMAIMQLVRMLLLSERR